MSDPQDIAPGPGHDLAIDVQTDEPPTDPATSPQGDQAPAQHPSTPDNPAVELTLSVEALLMTADQPVPIAKLAQVLDVPSSTKPIKEAIEQLNAIYEQTSRSFRIEPVAGGWQILTLPRFTTVLAAMHQTKRSSRLTPAGMETLAIIAYKQPILRADIEAIRGVASGEIIRGLMERQLVKIAGRAEELGRPMLYGTTKKFLQLFGLATIKDLPNTQELHDKQ